MRDLVRDEVWPIETVFDELGEEGFRRAIAPLQERVKERGLWAAHLPPELGGQGFGQVKLGLMHEILGTSPFAPAVFGNAAPDSRQQRDPRARGHAGPEGALPAPAAGGRPAQRVLDDRARDRRLRSHAAADARGARRRRVGHQRPQVVLDQRQRRRLPDRDGGHRPRRAAAPARLDAHRRRRHAGREHRPRHPDDGAPGRALRPLRRPRRDLLRGRARARRRAARRRGRGLPDRPAPARPGPHPPLHALARRLPAGVRHALRARACRATRSARCWPTSRRSRTGSRTRWRRCRPRG